MERRSRQLALDLRDAPRWGGRRAGAGRKPGAVRRDPHRRRAALHRAHPCHVTLKVRPGLPSLRSRRFVAELERSLRESCERGRFRVAHYSLQRDHVHAIVEAASGRDLANGMKSFGARLARAMHRVFRLRGSVLADRFHLHVLRTPREVRNAIAYVLLDARRHAARLGKRIDPTALWPPLLTDTDLFLRLDLWSRAAAGLTSPPPSPTPPPSRGTRSSAPARRGRATRPGRWRRSGRLRRRGCRCARAPSLPACSSGRWCGPS